MNGFILYRIYYGNMIIYIGRTKQDLQQRIRGHFFAKPMHRKIDIFNTTKIEFAECKTEADLYVYEVYYINKFHPPLNVDDRSHDNLTIELPDIEWKSYDCKLIEKWKSKLSKGENEKIYKRNYGAIQRVSEMLNDT